MVWVCNVPCVWLPLLCLVAFRAVLTSIRLLSFTANRDDLKFFSREERLDKNLGRAHVFLFNRQI